MTRESIAIADRGRYISAFLKSCYDRVSRTCVAWVCNAASDRKHHEERAISILRSKTADADAREWAERYLCGMAAADRDSFMTDRLAQS